MKRWLGLDLGSSFVKAAFVVDGSMINFVTLPVSGSYREQAQKALEMLCPSGDFDGLGITGVGADGVDLPGASFSEVAAHAKGVHVLFPQIRTVIDIGGQFTRVIRLGPEGRVKDFLISEKCATGSGRFLQIMARILRVGVDELGPLSLKARQPVEFSTGCAVFAESEAISRIAEGAKPEDIVAGVHKAMAAKVEMLIRRIGLESPVAVSGGGGEDQGLVKAIEKKLGVEVLVPPQPRLTAARGVACLASLNLPA